MADRCLCPFSRRCSGAEGKERAVKPWLIAALAASLAVAQDRVSRGRAVFLRGPCVMCHTIRGTPAGSRVGPDLTHVASRAKIAGVLPNRRGYLAGWILNPQNLKPGTQMPPTPLESRDFHDLLAYLESLR